MPAGYKAVHPSGRRHIEHHTRFPCPFITAANITAVTERLRVMTYIYVLPMREPFTVAKQVATLCAQSDYRFDFGIGASAFSTVVASFFSHTATPSVRASIRVILATWPIGTELP